MMERSRWNLSLRKRLGKDAVRGRGTEPHPSERLPSASSSSFRWKLGKETKQGTMGNEMDTSCATRDLPLSVPKPSRSWSTSGSETNSRHRHDASSSTTHPFLLATPFEIPSREENRSRKKRCAFQERCHCDFTFACGSYLVLSLGSSTNIQFSFHLGVGGGMESKTPVRYD